LDTNEIVFHPRHIASLSVIGWREWCALPDLDIHELKCKVDTGARTSTLHAFDVEVMRRGSRDIVDFQVHPLQRNTKKVVRCQAELLEWRLVTDSGGNRTLRPVIKTSLQLGYSHKEIELTLTSRDEMGFRMLLGREALRGVWLVDPAKSYLALKDLKKSGIKKKVQKKKKRLKGH
jgi:hypothetical protein